MEEQETGLLGGASQTDLEMPKQEVEETSINVFAEEPETPEATKMERPEDLPAEFWDEEAGNFKSNDIYEEMKKQKDIALGLRQKLSKGIPTSEAPEAPESYQLDSENIAEVLGYEIPEDDVGLGIFKKVAFENGLSQTQFESIFTGYMKEAVENEDLKYDDEQEQVDPQEYIDAEMGKLGKEAPALVQGIKNWNQQLFYDGLFNEEQLKTAQNMGMNAEEIRVINIYRAAAGNLSIPEMGNTIDGMPSQQEIDKIMASPDYENDPVMQKKVTDYFQQKYT